MKLHSKYYLFLALFLVLICGACTASADKSSTENTDSQEETQTACESDAAACEAASSAETDMHAWMSEISMDQAIEIFQNGESAVIYFGFDACPWCQDALPELKEAAGQTDTEVLFVRTRDENKELLYTDEQKAEITPYIQEYMSENDEGVLTLYVPLVIQVENGKAVSGHVGTLEDHDAKEWDLTEEEKEELLSVYLEILNRE